METPVFAFNAKLKNN